VWAIIQEAIDSSDYYISIIGHRYGSIITEGEQKGLSYTHKEFRYALSQKIPVLAFIMDKSVAVAPGIIGNDQERQKLEEFKDEVICGRTVEWWKNKDELNSKVAI
jgi:hypothetical protein